MVKDAKKITWQKFGEKLENNSQGNQKLFYNTLKKLRKEKQVKAITIKNKEGTILTKLEDVLDRWKEYFQEIQDEQIGNTSIIEIEEEKETNGEATGITEEELTEALKKIKNGKSPGHDKITAEMIKKMGRGGQELLLMLYNKLWSEEKIPKEWEVGQIVPIHKKGDNKQCNNYRGITLLSIPLKIYEHILEKKLRVTIEPTLLETQSGFRRGRSAQDHIFTIRQISAEICQYNRKAFLAFIDLEKAFDRVPRKKVWEALEKRGVTLKFKKKSQRASTETQGVMSSLTTVSRKNLSLRKG